MPVESTALAEIWCVPLETVVEFHDMLNGADFTGWPTFALSTRNWTWVIVPPSLAEAVALSVTVPLTEELMAGDVIFTEGSERLLLPMETGTAALVATIRSTAMSADVANRP